ncbi:MAG TPA: hypothetical protein DDX93_00810 [Smithella sp.]|jgi:hypothetical protein|nr:hypothetical protein [Smithella sp.]
MNFRNNFDKFNTCMTIKSIIENRSKICYSNKKEWRPIKNGSFTQKNVTADLSKGIRVSFPR